MGFQEKDLEFSIVSGSSEEMLFGCLESLTRTMTGERYRWSVTVTCNGQHPGLASRVRASYPAATIIENDAPRGFAANHNRVLRTSRARYVWLLNDDLLILPESVRKVTDFLDRPENARVAVVSPKLLNPDGTLQPSTYGFPSMPQILLAHSGLRELAFTDSVLKRLAPVLRSREGSSRYWAHDKTLEVDTLRGACVAIRMKAVRQVGPMIEVSVVGGEETDWHRRFHENGWKVVFFADASVIHYGSQTVRQGAHHFYPEYLKAALYFFRGRRGRGSYGLFCVALLGMFGVRVASAAIRGNRTGAGIARQYARVAWDGLRGR